MRIVDPARNMILLLAFTEDDTRITINGLRPGDSLYEEVLADGEHTRPASHPKLRIARARQVADDWVEVLLVWPQQTGSPEDSEVRSAIAQRMPEYSSGQTRQEEHSRATAG